MLRGQEVPSDNYFPERAQRINKDQSVNLEEVDLMFEGRRVSVGSSGKQKHDVCRETEQSSWAIFTSVGLGGIWSSFTTLISIVFARMPCGTSYKCWGYNKAQSH